MKIAEMTLGSNAQCSLVLAEVSVRKTNTAPPRPFLHATMTDGIEQIVGMFWQWSEENPMPKAGAVYDIIAQVREYQGRKQLTLSSFVLSEDQDLSRFEPTYDRDIEQLYSLAMEAIARIENEDLRYICETVYTDYAPQIKRSTSAVGVHHVGAGGNLAHTLETACIATAIATYFIDLGIPIDLDLTVAGALLHDIGKIATYSVNGPLIEYSEDGQLLDHIVIGIDMLTALDHTTEREYAEPLKLLKHILASHHGQKEYGSPVTPRFIEAYLVCTADGISATVDSVWQANLRAIRSGKSSTEKLWPQGNVPHFLQEVIAKKLHGTVLEK